MNKYSQQGLKLTFSDVLPGHESCTVNLVFIFAKISKNTGDNAEYIAESFDK